MPRLLISCITGFNKGVLILTPLIFVFSGTIITLENGNSSTFNSIEGSSAVFSNFCEKIFQSSSDGIKQASFMLVKINTDNIIPDSPHVMINAIV